MSDVQSGDGDKSLAASGQLRVLRRLRGVRRRRVTYHISFVCCFFFILSKRSTRRTSNPVLHNPGLGILLDVCVSSYIIICLFVIICVLLLSLIYVLTFLV